MGSHDRRRGVEPKHDRRARKGGPPSMLARLLARWGETRDPGLADAADRFTAHHGRLARTEIAKLEGKALSLAFERAIEHGDPLEIGVAAPEVGRGSLADMAHRIELLVEVSDDPRISRVLVTTVMAPPFASLGARSAYGKALDRVVAIGD